MANLFGTTYTRQELLKRVGTMDQLAGIHLGEIVDGIGRGVRTAEFHTGSGLNFRVLVDRGFDIYDASYLGQPLAWLSSTGPTHPAYFEPPDLGWRRTFYGGLLLTCGLTTIGAPSIDEGEMLGLHGRISNLPASNVTTGDYWEGDEYVIYAQGQVRETLVFGENLVLRRRIEARLGESAISIQDTVTNEGYLPAPHMILYHINAGFPVIDNGTRFIAPSHQVSPRDAEARTGVMDYQQFSAPIPHYQEQVFFHEMDSHPDGTVTTALVNARGFGFYCRYRKAELPCFNEWKMMGEGVYAVGMEPATNWVSGRASERERGALQILEPGEMREYHLEIGIVTSSDVTQMLQDEILNQATPS